MIDHRVFAVLLAAFTILLNDSYGSEEAECKDVNNYRVLKTCCNINFGEMITEEEKAVGSMCEKTVYGDRTDPTTDEERLCMEECLFNGTHLLTDDMKLNETALLAEYDVTVKKFLQWKEPINKATTKCIEKNDERCNKTKEILEKCLS